MLYLNLEQGMDNLPNKKIVETRLIVSIHTAIGI